MPDTGSLVAALYNAVLGGGGQAGSQAGGVTYTTLEWPGMPVDAARYGNIWATDRPSGSAEALEAFSSLVDDDLPALGTVFEAAGISLPQIYALILQAQSPPGALTGAFAAAQAKFATVLRGSLENPGAQFHPSWPTPDNWCDPAGAGLWTQISIAPNARPPAPSPSLSSTLKALFARTELFQVKVLGPLVGSVGASPLINAMAERTRFQHLRPAAVATTAPTISSNQILFREAATRAAAASKSTVDIAAMAGKRGFIANVNPSEITTTAHLNARALGRTGATVASSALPPKVFQTLKQFTDQPFDDNTSERDHLDASLQARADQPGQLQSEPPLVLSQPVTATQVGLSFKYIRVAIRRPWLDPTLLRLPGWSISGLPQGSISNGHVDVNPGMMPIVPTGFIAIRDVVLKGQWADTDKQAITAGLEAGSLASVGPFTLSAGGPALGGFDGSSLTLPGIAIIAWTCSAMPLLPPL